MGQRSESWTLHSLGKLYCRVLRPRCGWALGCDRLATYEVHYASGRRRRLCAHHRRDFVRTHSSS